MVMMSSMSSGMPVADSSFGSNDGQPRTLLAKASARRGSERECAALQIVAHHDGGGALGRVQDVHVVAERELEHVVTRRAGRVHEHRERVGLTGRDGQDAGVRTVDVPAAVRLRGTGHDGRGGVDGEVDHLDSDAVSPVGLAAGCIDVEARAVGYDGTALRVERGDVEAEHFLQAVVEGVGRAFCERELQFIADLDAAVTRHNELKRAVRFGRVTRVFDHDVPGVGDDGGEGRGGDVDVEAGAVAVVHADDTGVGVDHGEAAAGDEQEGDEGRDREGTGHEMLQRNGERCQDWPRNKLR